MLSVSLAVAAAVGAFVLGLVRFGWGSAVFMAILAGVGVLILLLRRARKPVQAAVAAVEADLKAGRFERAIERLESVRRLGLWQPLFKSQIDEQIGVIRYAALKDPDGARPYLERARHKGVQAWTMLAASLYRRRRYDEMEQVFRRATRRRPKEGLLWASYAWCRLGRGRRAEALEVLARGRKRLPGDDRLRRLQLAVQNGKPARMRAFGADWYALELEPAPAATAVQHPSVHHPALRRR